MGNAHAPWDGHNASLYTLGPGPIYWVCVNIAQALHASWLFIAMYEYECIHLENTSTAPFKPFKSPLIKFDAYINKY
jgi:hypothetical protein